MIQNAGYQGRILAIDPTSRGFGFAVLEGAERLIDWGVRSASGNKNGESLRRIAEFASQYQPDVIALEDYSGHGSRRCARVRELIEGIREMAAQDKIRTASFSRADVRGAFEAGDASTKHQIATVIAGRFLELAPRLPPFRKCWMSEDYRMGIFDAVALALTFFHAQDKRAPSLQGPNAMPASAATMWGRLRTARSHETVQARQATHRGRSSLAFREETAARRLQGLLKDEAE